MSVYLQDIPVEEAVKLLQQKLTEQDLWGVLGIETIPVDENALGRVLAEPIWAAISSPHYHSAAMDGFAVHSSKTEGATLTQPLELAVGEGAVYVDTGDPLPDWADAVIPIEQVEPLTPDGKLSQDIRHPSSIRIRSAIVPWQNIRPMGEDIVATQLVLPSGHILRAFDLGAIAASGWSEIKVTRKPRVAIIPTGDELVSIGSPIKPGDIIEYNSIVLAAQIRSYGGEARRYPIVKDKFTEIQQVVKAAAGMHDLILLNAGSSAGAEDFSAAVIQSLGEVFVHGIAVRPGHPVIMGMVKDNGNTKKVPIIGVPGYPVSAALTNEIFIKPILERWLGMHPAENPQIEAVMTKKITSPAGDDDYIRVVVGKVGERVCAAPLSRGAGVITSLTQADGLIVVPRGTQGVEAGEKVKVNLLRPVSQIDRTILAIGSHDVSLDVLAQYVAKRNGRLVSANVGSLGGLIALKRGEAHLAGSHLLEPETGIYNIPYIKQYLSGMEVYLIGFALRTQGLIVLPGNPDNINSLEDLVRPDITFINRQSGAGTRVLLDYELKKGGIDPRSIKGYDRQEFTHLAVAAAVASKRASCGLGIAAAAQALGLDFIPLFQEEYDLVIPAVYYESPLLKPLMETLVDEEFRKQVQQLPGYDFSPIGKFLAHITS